MSGYREGALCSWQLIAGIAGSQLTRLGWWQHLHHYVPIGLVGVISRTVWLSRFPLSRVYRPVPPGFSATTSVVVPSYREDPDILDRCVTSWLRENPTEIIVVPDVGDTDVIGRLEARDAVDPRLKVIPFVHHGKRSALGVAIRQASQEILVLCDSDTGLRRHQDTADRGQGWSDAGRWEPAAGRRPESNPGYGGRTGEDQQPRRSPPWPPAPPGDQADTSMGARRSPFPPLSSEVDEP